MNITISGEISSMISGILLLVFSEHHRLISLTVAGLLKSLEFISAEYEPVNNDLYAGSTLKPSRSQMELALES